MIFSYKIFSCAACWSMINNLSWNSTSQYVSKSCPIMRCLFLEVFDNNLSSNKFICAAFSFTFVSEKECNLSDASFWDCLRSKESFLSSAWGWVGFCISCVGFGMISFSILVLSILFFSNGSGGRTECSWVFFKFLVCSSIWTSGISSFFSKVSCMDFNTNWYICSPFWIRSSIFAGCTLTSRSSESISKWITVKGYLCCIKKDW